MDDSTKKNNSAVFNNPAEETQPMQISSQPSSEESNVVQNNVWGKGKRKERRRSPPRKDRKSRKYKGKPQENNSGSPVKCVRRPEPQRGWREPQGKRYVPSYVPRGRGKGRRKWEKTRERTRERGFRIGDEVRAEHGNGRFYPAIVQSKGRWTYDVLFKGRESEGVFTIKENQIRAIGRARDFRSAQSRDDLSRGLTKLLRHTARQEGLAVMADGFVRLQDIERLPRFCGATLEDVRAVVQNCNKQRLALVQKNNEWYIRANQGHSMKGIDSSEIFTPVLRAEELPVCIHGTYSKHLGPILKTGLNKMRRTHIHFTPSEVVTDEARSGFRNSCDVLIYLDVPLALEAGLKLFRSANNVILSPGFDGVIPSKFFRSVYDRRQNKEIFTNQEKVVEDDNHSDFSC